MEGGSSSHQRISKQRNFKLRKPFQVETDRTKDSEHARTLELEHVLGLTVFSNSALTSDPSSGLVAYPAGCVLVLLDCVKYKQLGTLHTPRKSITAAKFSPDGRYVLTGETGLHPAVRVWELSSMMEVATLKGHSVGIISVCFTPRMREIIVVGDAQDMMISVWAWPSKIMKTLNKFADEIYAMAVAEDSSFFTTVGNRHVKFYYLDNLRSLLPHAGQSCPIPLPTRCGILDNLKDNCFCDVVCGRGSSSLYIFVVAMSGILCQISRDRYLERWVHVNMMNACCLTADENCVFVGGSQGVVRMFRALDLQIITTLPRPHILGLDISQVTASYIQDVSDENSSTLEEESKDKETPSQYPTTRAITYDSCHEILTVVYSDRSIYIWSRRKQGVDSSEGFYFSKKYSSMYHRGCVWGLTTYPAVLDSDPEEAALGGALPPGALISVSADGTLRAWDVCANICEESLLKRNCVSAECLKIVYADNTDSVKKLQQQTKPREGSFIRYGKQSFSAVAVCPDGLHIATGNQHGRVCIYDTNTMKVMTTMLAHEAEVTALGYSITKRYKLLASGSRDRMIHVMDASRGYQLLTTLDDHSSTITAINFTYIARCILMVTSSLDMSVLIRAYLDSNVFSFKPVRAIVEKKSVVDFAINQWSGLIALACQDRLVRVYSIISPVENTTFRGCPSHGGSLVKIQIDPSGQYLVTACCNRTINLLLFSTGIILNTFYGHAESITSVKFSHNMKHIITSAIDGCIFLWRLPESVTYAVKREMAEMGKLTRGMVLGERWKKSRLVSDVLSEPEFNLTASSSDLKLDASLYSVQTRQVKNRLEDNRHTALSVKKTKSSHRDGATDSSEQLVVKTLADVRPNLWTSGFNTSACAATSDVSSSAVAVPKEDATNNKSIKWPNDEGPVENVFQSCVNNHLSSGSLSPTSEAWLSACYERRRIFKLEARSIKKILAMMRLVTDAMEKDLAGSNWLMYSSSSNQLSQPGGGAEVLSRRLGHVTPSSARQHPQAESSLSFHQHMPSSTNLAPISSMLQSSPRQAGSLLDCKDSNNKSLLQEKLPSRLQASNLSQNLHKEKEEPLQVQADSIHLGEHSSGPLSSPAFKPLLPIRQPRHSCGLPRKRQPSSYNPTRIPIPIGSSLLRSVSRHSENLATKTSDEWSAQPGMVEVAGRYTTSEKACCLDNSDCNHSTEGTSLTLMDSTSSDSLLLDSSLGWYCHHSRLVEPMVIHNDNTNKQTKLYELEMTRNELVQDAKVQEDTVMHELPQSALDDFKLADIMCKSTSSSVTFLATNVRNVELLARLGNCQLLRNQSDNSPIQLLKEIAVGQAIKNNGIDKFEENYASQEIKNDGIHKFEENSASQDIKNDGIDKFEENSASQEIKNDGIHKFEENSASQEIKNDGIDEFEENSASQEIKNDGIDEFEGANRLEDLLKEDSLLETFSDKLPSVCDLVENEDVEDDELILEGNSHSEESEDVATVTNLESSHVNEDLFITEYAAEHCCSGGEGLRSEIDILPGNKDCLAVDRGDGDKAICCQNTVERLSVDSAELSLCSHKSGIGDRYEGCGS